MITSSIAIVLGCFVLVAALTSPARALKIAWIIVSGGVKIAFVVVVGLLTLGLIFSRVASGDGGNHVPAGPRFE